jgi:hypothetical protein
MLVWLLRDDPRAGFGRYYLDNCSVPAMSRSFMYVYDLLFGRPGVAPRSLDGLSRTYHAPGVGHVFTRSDWSRSATWITVAAGPLTESHAHREQGAFTVFKREWLAFDEGILTASGIRQEETVHNLIRLERDGKPLRMGHKRSAILEALDDTGPFVYTAVDITPMYAEAGGVSRLERELLFFRPDVLVVFDRVETDPGLRRVWQLNTPVAPRILADRVDLNGQGSKLTLFPLSPRAKVETIEWAKTGKDYLGGHRVDLVGDASVSTFLNVLAVDGAALKVAPSDEPGQRGVDVSLADGSGFRLRFRESGIGGHLSLRDRGGRLDKGRALTAGLVPIPVTAKRGP